MVKRIQRRRAKGWRMPEGAVYVGRGSRWGNPYRIAPAFDLDGIHIPEITADSAVKLFRENLESRMRSFPSVRAELVAILRGKDLACWCPLDAPCHADVLLEIANRSDVPNGETL